MGYCVYRHTVPNGKVYIGITSVNPLKRWSNGHGYKNNKMFWKDIVLYGWLNITHEILQDGLSECDARALESKLICEHKSYVKEYGYNVQVGMCYVDDTHIDREQYLLHCKDESYKKKCVPKSAQCKEVYQYDLSGNFICKFNSIGEASRQTGLNKYCIRDCLRGKQKTYKGFLFRPSPG